MPFYDKKSSIQYIGLLRREVRRFLKVPLQTIGTPIISSLLYMLIFGVSLGSAIDLDSGLSYIAFLLPGLLTMSLIRNAFENSSSSIIGSKYVNELQDLRMTPLSRHQIVLALGTAALIRGCMVALLTLGVGLCFTTFPIPHPLFFIAIIVLSGLTFGMLGLAIAMRSRSFEHISTINSFVLVPLIYLGGTFVPITKLHPFWQTISKWNPIFYIINSIRYAMVGVADAAPYRALGIICIALLLAYTLAIRALRPGASYSRTL
jgi:ABC-2 type transport system permease protein